MPGAGPDAQRARKKLIKPLVNDGFNPIVFCRFMLRRLRRAAVGALRNRAPSKMSKLKPSQAFAFDGAEERVALSASRASSAFAKSLSEGINLQRKHFERVTTTWPWNQLGTSNVGPRRSIGRNSESVRVLITSVGQTVSGGIVPPMSSRGGTTSGISRNPDSSPVASNAVWRRSRGPSYCGTGGNALDLRTAGADTIRDEFHAECASRRAG